MKQRAPATAEEAAERFRDDTGIDLATDERYALVFNVLSAMLLAQSVAEYARLPAAVARALDRVPSKSMGALKTLKRIKVQFAISELTSEMYKVVARSDLAVEYIQGGVLLLKSCVDVVRASGITMAKSKGRPKALLRREVCRLLVDQVEGVAGHPRLTAPQVSHVAQAYGLAEPSGSWRDWTDKWGRLLAEARRRKSGNSQAPGKMVKGRKRAQVAAGRKRRRSSRPSHLTGNPP